MTLEETKLPLLSFGGKIDEDRSAADVVLLVHSPAARPSTLLGLSTNCAIYTLLEAEQQGEE